MTRLLNARTLGGALSSVVSSSFVRSFFPQMARRQREVVIDPRAFGDISPFTLAGVLRQGLGHPLGFRHEHTRPESGAPECFEDLNWRALTEYDSASVMHDPRCNGTQSGDLVLTNSDKAGVAILYPFPQ